MVYICVIDDNWIQYVRGRRVDTHYTHEFFHIHIASHFLELMEGE